MRIVKIVIAIVAETVAHPFSNSHLHYDHASRRVTITRQPNRSWRTSITVD